MTARSGDALSHVDFQARLKVVLRQLARWNFIRAPNRGLARVTE
jgi:hypothetical protein